VDLAKATIASMSLDVEPQTVSFGGGPCFGSWKGKPSKGKAPPMMPMPKCSQHVNVPQRFGRQTYALTRVTGAQSDEEQILAAYRPDGEAVASLSIPVAGGPFAVAVDATRRTLVVATLFARDVTAFEILAYPTLEADAWLPPRHVVALSHTPGLGLTADAAEGRELFHRATDAAIPSDGRAGASWHP